MICEVAIGEVIAPRREKAHPGDFPDLPYIGLEHVEPHAMRLLGHSLAGQMSSIANRFYSGDLLYSRLRPYLNKVITVSLDGLCSSEFIVIPNSEFISSEFLKYLLNSSDFVAFANGLNAGDRPRVDFEQISSFKFLLPSSFAQTRIVAKLEELLSDLNAGVAELKAAQKKLVQYRQSLIKAAVEGALTADWRTHNTPPETGAQLLQRILTERRARWEAKQLAKFKEQGKTPPKDWQTKYREPLVPDTSELPDLPSGWCWATTQLVGEVLLGRQRAPQYLTGRWPRHYLRVANIKDDRIDFSNVESMDFDEIHFDKYRLLAGDILVSEGQSPELVGQSAIFRRHHQPLCFQKTLHRFRSLPGVVLPEFAQLVFRTHVYTGVFRAVASITTNIAHLTLEKFEVVRFPLPPLAEQIEIVAAADLRLSAVKAMEMSLTTCFQQSTAQRKNILRAAFSGQLVPQDPNDEPASVLLERIRAEREARGAMYKPRGRKAKELA